jgi:hypothetical protein
MEQIMSGNKMVTVLTFGSAPFFDAGEGTRIPNGYTCSTTVSGIAFIGVTRVVGCGVNYKFLVRDKPTVKSGWHRNPHKALGEALTLLGKPDLNKNALHAMGLFTEHVQTRIKDVEFEWFTNRVLELAIPDPPPKETRGNPQHEPAFETCFFA